MAEPPPIFDRALQRRRLARAVTAGAADFLLAWTVEELCERLGTVKRRFRRIVDIGTPLPQLAQALTAADQAALVVRLAGSPTALGAAPVLALVGDEEALPFPPESFDLAVSALALHQVNDLPGALIQIRRTLQPDGLFLAAMLGGRSLDELRQTMAMAEADITGGVSPRVAPFADVRDMGGLLQRAGFALPVADTESLTVRYANVFALAADLRAMGATNTLIERAKQPTRRQIFLRAAEIYAERFSDPDGRIRATFEIIFLSGWAPHESQQKPLAPGSAKMRLADALKTKDIPPA
ncbi:MAG: class I SAM-dependent methyltransferase [Methylovirgula sp.]